MSETPDDRLKRLRMRSWRRGTKEMDLVLGPYADARLAGLGETELAVYDQVLQENDQDLILWVMGTVAPPVRFAALMAEISAFARSRRI
ncbi:MAG: succinate dehydrogenase assembly factor 2 [bacterium]